MKVGDNYKLHLQKKVKYISKLVQFISHLFSAKENVKTASYASVVIVGIALTGGVLYALYKDMSEATLRRHFQYGADKCINHEKVQDLLGKPVYVVRTGRTRRRLGEWGSSNPFK